MPFEEIERVGARLAAVLDPEHREVVAHPRRGASGLETRVVDRADGVTRGATLHDLVTRDAVSGDLEAVQKLCLCIGRARPEEHRGKREQDGECGARGAPKQPSSTPHPVQARSP